MKKIYLLAGALATGLVATAQINPVSIPAKNSKNQPGFAKKSLSSTEKAQGDVLWSNNFTTASDWTISNAGAAGTPPHTAGDWAIVNALPTSLTSQIPTYGFPAAMVSTSGGNFALVNSDAAGGTATQNAYLTTAVGIDLATLLSANASAANATMYLEFNEIYRNYYDGTFVSISNDGGVTWVEFEVNPETEVPVNTNSSSPEVEILNITSVIGAGNWGTDVRIRFRYQGAWDWFWGIDDVKLVEAWDNDVKVTNFYQATPAGSSQVLDYYLVNQSQASFPGLTFGAKVLNNGSLAQTGVALNATDGGTYDETGTAVALPFAGTDSISVTVPYMLPSIVGDYNVDVASVLTGVTDSDLDNNSKTMTIRRDQYLYSRDDGNRISAISGVQGATDAPLKIGNVMEFFDAMDINFIQIRMSGAAADAGLEIFGEIQLYNPGTQAYEFLAETSPYVLQAADVNGFVTLPIDGGAVSVAPGDVILLMAGHNGGTSVPAFGLAQATEEQTVLLYSGTSNISYLGTPNAVMIRVSDQPLALDENTADFSVNVFPNPAVNEAAVSFELTNSADVTLTVTDLAGKVVYTNVLGNTAAGQHSVGINTAALAGGVYAVNFSANNAVVTKKLVVKK